MILLTMWSVKEGSNMTITLTGPASLSADLSHVSETGLLTLYCRAIESQSADPILVDEKAVDIAGRLRPALAASGRESLRRLARGRVSPNLAVHIALRARHYDEAGCDFLARHPDGVIANLGCGMDTRFFRIDDGRVLFFDLDLPEMIACKRQFFAESERYHLIGASVFDQAWMEQVAAYGRRPLLCMAEGLFMYLDPAGVQALVLTLQRRFPGSELICEVVNKRWIGAASGWMVRSKLQGSMKIGAGAAFCFGVSDGREMETWSPGIRLLGEWSYFDSRHPKLGLLGWMGRFELFRKAQWTLHYQLGS
jgi:methyltransferase (TIGR00027 family)